MNGGYAEYVAVGEDNVTRVPDGVALHEAAIVACAIGTELNAIRDVAHVQAGDKVLVTGAGGGLGIHGVQLARLAGGFVVALTTSADKAQLIADAGAHEVIVGRRGEVKPIITATYPLEKAAEAHHAVPDVRRDAC